MAHRRGGVVIIEDGRVALIERVNARGTYYLFPGGGVEDGESVEAAAVREAREELGVDVMLGDLLAIVSFGQSVQYFYAAQIVGGIFGTGTGEEFTSLPDSAAGTYKPVWLELETLQEHNVRPAELARRLQVSGAALGEGPLHLMEAAP